MKKEASSDKRDAQVSPVESGTIHPIRPIGEMEIKVFLERCRLNNAGQLSDVT